METTQATQKRVRYQFEIQNKLIARIMERFKPE